MSLGHDDDVDRIVAFLRGVGIGVREDAVPDDAFLPGLRIERGELVFERARLRWPGDLLHEAGHVAVTPATLRDTLSDALDDHAGSVDGGEAEATAWAYAACVAIGLDPAVLFHAGGYHGKSAALIATYTLGVYPGAGGLARNGMTLTAAQARERGAASYPHLIRWLRD